MIRFALFCLFLVLVSTPGCKKKADSASLCKKFVELGMVKDDANRQAECEKYEADMKKTTGAGFQDVADCFVAAEGKEAAASCVLKYADPEAAKKAFSRYQSRGKALEARSNLRRIAIGVEMAYKYPKAEGLTVPEPSLPDSVGPTPKKGANCQLGGFVSGASDWQHPTWQLLEFELVGALNFSYEYRKDADGQGFEALAYGDLDCDGEYSTFRLAGKIVDGDVVRGEIEVENETE